MLRIRTAARSVIIKHEQLLVLRRTVWRWQYTKNRCTKEPSLQLLEGFFCVINMPTKLSRRSILASLTEHKSSEGVY